MRIGVPKEIKVLENRVGLVPGSVREAVAHGHEVIVEHNAGQGIGMDDEAYRKAGATRRRHRRRGVRRRRHDRQGQGAAGGRAQDAAQRARSCSRTCTSRPIPSRRRISSRAAPSASPTRRSPRRRGGLPLLAPMSEVAGRMAVQAGAYYLEKPHGGLGMLLGGVPGVDPGEGRDPGRRRRRLARVPHRARHGRRCVGARPQRRGAARAVAAVRPAAQHGVLDARRDRASRDHAPIS